MERESLPPLRKSGALAQETDGLVVAGYVTGVLVPPVGFFVGFALVLKNRFAHGVAIMVLSVAVVAVAAFIAVTPAEAGWKMNRATAIANTVWNTPCDGHVKRLWSDFYAPPNPSPRGALANAVPEQCAVNFNSGERWPWEKLCTVVVHEWGHLAWYRDPSNLSDPIHSSNPESVMYVGVGAGNFEPTRGWVTDRHGKRHYVKDWTDTSMDERCRENGRPYLEKHGLLRPR